MSNRMKINIILVFLIIFVIFSFSIQRSIAKTKQEELAQRNGFSLLMSLIELDSESGNAYEKALHAHREFFRRTIEEIENHQLPLHARLFSFPSKTINIKKLKKLKKELDKPITTKETKDKDDEARIIIENTRTTTSELLFELQQLLSEPITFSKSQNVPDGLRDEVAKALQESHNRVLDYISGVENNLPIKNQLNLAMSACHENRKAICLSFFAFYIYQDFFIDEIVLRDFRENIDRSIYYNNVLSKSLPSGDEAKGRLKLYSQSELRRRDILQAIIGDDMPKAQELLLAAADKAISEEESN